VCSLDWCRLLDGIEARCVVVVLMGKLEGWTSVLVSWKDIGGKWSVHCVSTSSSPFFLELDASQHLEHSLSGIVCWRELV
jgi:hypothetical protein